MIASPMWRKLQQIGICQLAQIATGVWFYSIRPRIFLILTNNKKLPCIWSKGFLANALIVND
jgi:hypothetical protein